MKFEQMPQINDTEQEVKEVKKIKKAGIWLGLAAALTPATSIAQTATEVNQENVSGTENKKLESPQTLAESEGKEKEILGERFFGQTRLYRVIYGDLNEKQIQFFNDHGVPLGAPTELVPIIERNGESITIISPGVIDKDGFLIGKINKGWLDKKRQGVCLAYQNVKCDLSVDLPALLIGIVDVCSLSWTLRSTILASESKFDSIVDASTVKYSSRALAIAEDRIAFGPLIMIILLLRYVYCCRRVNLRKI